MIDWAQSRKLFFVGLLALLPFVERGALAYDGKPAAMSSTDKPKELEGIGVDEQLGQNLDLNLKVVNESGEEKSLGEYFKKGRPVVLSLIYFGCPGLCNFHLNGVVETMKELDWNAGNEFELIALSFDSKEGSDLGFNKKKTYVDLYGRGEKGAGGMHFLTAQKEVIDQITSTVGFKYRWDEAANEWAHASAAVFLSPEGKITRYLHGIMFDPPTFKMAINEASQGKVGSFVDQMIYYCFKYDPTQSKYTLYAFRLVQLGGVLIILILGALLVPHWIRSRRETVRRTNQ